jgi:hypothetical protein
VKNDLLLLGVEDVDGVEREIDCPRVRRLSEQMEVLKGVEDLLRESCQ